MSTITHNLPIGDKKKLQVIRGTWLNGLITHQIKKEATGLRITSCKSDNWPLVFNQLTNHKQITDLSVLLCNISADITPEISQMTQLKSLILPRYRLTRDRVCNLTKLVNLTQIVLIDCHLTDESVTVICSFLTRISKIDFSLNQVTDFGAKAIARSQGNLHELNLHQNNITSEGCSEIVRRHNDIVQLRIGKILVNFGYNHVGDDGVKQISRCLGKLTVLSVVSNGITCLGAIDISKNCPKLKTLHIDNNQIRALGAINIACHLHNLEYLRIKKNFIPALRIKHIKQSHQRCQIDDTR